MGAISTHALSLLRATRGDSLPGDRGPDRSMAREALVGTASTLKCCFLVQYFRPVTDETSPSVPAIRPAQAFLNAGPDQVIGRWGGIDSLGTLEGWRE